MILLLTMFGYWWQSLDVSDILDALTPLSENCRQYVQPQISVTNIHKTISKNILFHKKSIKYAFSKINAIKKRIDDIEAAAAIQSDSDLNLSDLSD